MCKPFRQGLRWKSPVRACVFILIIPWWTVQPASKAQSTVKIIPIAPGWARSSVNASIFRMNSVTSRGGVQFAAFYDSTGAMILAKRRLGSDKWKMLRTPYRGNVRDAHNAISIAVDGDGFLHAAWDHHGQPLNYARGIHPMSLELSAPIPMTCRNESCVTYPQFVNLPGGGLLFLYRDGASGNGNVMLNRYDLEDRNWTPVRHPLIDGQGERNAYVNSLVVDKNGGWHISWCWRETQDVATNHDILYAHSTDQGGKWLTSSGLACRLPLVSRKVEEACAVPEGSDLINQTTMAVDGKNRPLIASYWRGAGDKAPQFRLVWHDGLAWRVSPVGKRTLDFQLAGGGTKRVPVSRPLVLAGPEDAVVVVFRDAERGGGVSAAISRDVWRSEWRIFDVHPSPAGQWEPTCDFAVWKSRRRLHLFFQAVGQGDAETMEDIAPQPVSILEWDPF